MMNQTTKINVFEAGQYQIFIVANVCKTDDSAEAANQIYTSIAGILKERQMEVVQERIFGSLSVREQVVKTRALLFDESDPLTYMEGHPVWGEGLAGIIIHAVSYIYDTSRLLDKAQKPIGRMWGEGDLYLTLQGIHGLVDDGDNSPHAQTRKMIERLDENLVGYGGGFECIARTWFYLSDILDWYDDFNDSRSKEYENLELMPMEGDTELFLPASTGIGANNQFGAAGVLDAYATIGADVKFLSNVSQEDAFKYGSAFSRGAVIEQDDFTLLHLSGTAAIDEQGNSLHDGDFNAQIDCTFDKAGKLIESCGATIGDICAATVFIKSPDYMPSLRESAKRRGMDLDSCVCVVADVCRKELLFEFDAQIAFDIKK